MLAVATSFGAQSSSLALAPVPGATLPQALTTHLAAIPAGMTPSAANLTMSSLDPYTPTTGTPDYFGTPDPTSLYPVGNFANSPLPTSVMISGAGTGAMFIAQYSTSGANQGQITGFKMLTPGYGYDYSTTVISVIGGGGTGGKGGNITLDSSGGITAIQVTNPGSGYGTANGLRKFVQDLPDLAVATPTHVAAVKTVGNPNYIPAADAYEIAAVRTQWQFSPDLGMTTVNLYAQVDTANAGTNCPTGELNWKYPDGSFITNGAGQNVCFIQTNFDPATQTLAPFSYLGPSIVANQGVPVRVTFDNYLPSGTQACTVAGGTIATNVTTNVNKCGGDLFLPVDPSVMGAGAGPNGGFYSTNRATIHLHGGVTPWISDGTMDQWVSPASSQEQYPAGVSTRYVPDMWFTKSGATINGCYGYLYCYTSKTNQGTYVGSDSKTAPSGYVADAPSASSYPSTNPGNGRMTFYYTNQQTARLMFYHDHSDGITRLNVYSGLVAGFLLHDTQEGKVMAAAGIRDAANPNTVNTAQEKVIVIQDKTFVPSASQLKLQDPTWNSAAWGGLGNLWFPHVYMPNQNPALTPVNSTTAGASMVGRWDYGPWFWPAVTTEMQGPVTNPLYHGPCAAGSINNYCENSTNPGVPNVSQVPEAFNDSMTVNGVSYPVMHAARKVYRLQILNGSNDRTLSLNLYYAKSSASPKNVGYTPACTGPLWTNPATDTTPNCGDAGEIAMVPATQNTPGTQGLIFPDQIQHVNGGMVPDMRQAGPAIVQLSSEGGILPDPYVINTTPIGYDGSNQSITITNVKEQGLLLGPAQRADVLIDLTNVPEGSTLILYNDAPAPFPGWDPRLDYYTGDVDQTASGGAPTTIPGYAPNTRTIMQIKVDQDPQGVPGATIFNPDGTVLSSLVTAVHNDYKISQDAHVVAQVAYNGALGTSTQNNVYPQLADTTATVNSTGVSSISVDSTKLTSATGTPQVLIGNQISPITSGQGGNGNGARAIAHNSPNGGVASVDTAPGVTYVTTPSVTSITPNPSGTGRRATKNAIVKTHMAGSGDLTGVTVTPNSGYTATPNVTVTGIASIPAVAKAILAPTSISGFSISYGGLFTSTPGITISGPTQTFDVQTATAVLAPSPISAINVLSGGLYTSAPTITVTGSTTTAVTATAFLSTSVASITLRNAGACTFTGSYNSRVNYFRVNLFGGGLNGITPAGGNLATATARANQRGNSLTVSGISVVLPGKTYSTAPTVNITPVGMTCTTRPTATALLTPGPIAGVTLVGPDLGTFTATPVVTASSGTATFSAVLLPTPISSITLTGTRVRDFTGTPTVTVNVPSSAIIKAILTPTSVASVSIAAGTGIGYTTQPTITIDPPQMPNGVPAYATATMGAPLLRFTVLDPGAGYTPGQPYDVNLSDGTKAIATIGDGRVASIEVTNPGSGYLSAPNVELLYPDGTADPVSATAALTTQSVTMNWHATGIQELFEMQYARMDAIMSSEIPLTTFNNQTTLPWSSVDSPTEILNTNSVNELAANGGQPVDSLPDGTQIWRFTHNGVDTHFIHFHMFNVQVVAIIGWDGINQTIPGYDLGWRDTVQMDQLTTVYIAVKPVVPIVPWQLPNSVRPLSPTETIFAADGSTPITTQDPMMSAFDPANNGVVAANQLVNFGWEYMFHCHILGHEEGDMMRPIPVGVVLTAPTAVKTTYVRASRTQGAHVDVTFIDNSVNETGFILQRRTDESQPWVTVAMANRPAPTWDNLHQLVIDPSLSTGSQETLTDQAGLTDSITFGAGTSYQYQVLAIDQIGTANLGTFPTTTVDSDPSNIIYVQN
jgi:FtsP/CotA-like multicopper oxidase with cupredoxin domain